MRNMYYVDMHCHPALKPYSWYKRIKQGKGPSKERDVKQTSLWHRDPPDRCDRLLNILLGLTKFTQSDFTTLAEGNVKIISACLNPIERGLFTAKGRLDKIAPRLIKFIVELRIEFIEGIRKKQRNYFTDLKEEYKFYKREEKNQDPTSKDQFILTRNYCDIENNLNDPEKNIISVFFSIEGCHVFNNGGLENSFKEDKEIVVETKNIQIVKKNIQEVKKWCNPPLYVSIAHHMNNDLCGHARSLSSAIGKRIDQEEGMNGGFSRIGEAVLHELLKKNPCRIYIDIKHMSTNSRVRYYEILDSENYIKERIPVIVSHGAVNGLKEIPPRTKGEEFNSGDINFYDDEIIRIHRSGGFLGIQLDERRLYPETQKRSERWTSSRKERWKRQSKAVWNQIYHIAKVLDDEGLYGWDTATIGSDNDGIVDTLNGYWTSKEFGILEEYLFRHAHEFLNSIAACSFQNPENTEVSACEIIDSFIRGKAQRFLEEFYTDDARFTTNQEERIPCEDPG